MSRRDDDPGQWLPAWPKPIVVLITAAFLFQCAVIAIGFFGVMFLGWARPQ